MSFKIDRIQAHYARRVTPDRPSHDILDWATPEAQYARFEVFDQLLTRATANSASPSVLDVGCGLTDLASFLGEHGRHVSYVGVDLTAEILREALRRHPDRNVVQADVFGGAPFPAGTFHAAFCSGIFNLRLGNNAAFVRSALQALLPLTTGCVVANFLHCRARRQYPHCFYFDPKPLCEFARSFAREVVLVEDYLENDFTVMLIP